MTDAPAKRCAIGQPRCPLATGEKVKEAALEVYGKKGGAAQAMKSRPQGLAH
jgi:hypothetical protein